MLADDGLSSEQHALFKAIFVNDIPMLDLRSPSEYEQGAFPSSTNIPLMTNEQRAQVGTCYKQQGQEAAIKLGHQLVSGQTREALLEQWQNYFNANPSAWLYCFRGCLRSKTVAEWLTAQGLSINRIEGGYKALRRYLISTIESVTNTKVWVIGGQTGSAKTHFVNRWQESIDLEGLANHRGSSFGRRPQGQPTVINFENRIAIELLKITDSSSQLVVEDEGVTIGSCSMPIPLRQQMLEAPVLLLTLDFESRVETILHDYIIHLASEFEQTIQDNPYGQYVTAMMASLERIKKRLGGERYRDIAGDMQRALEHRDHDLHRIWIAKLLELYYDPMYCYQLENKADRIVIEGDEGVLTDFLKSQGLTLKAS
jgi:tRNA 2-selenouridine synthase